MVEYGRGGWGLPGITNLGIGSATWRSFRSATGGRFVRRIRRVHHARHPHGVSERSSASPGGRIVVLDRDEARPGGRAQTVGEYGSAFPRWKCSHLLRQAGFEDIDLAIVDRAEEAPHCGKRYGNQAANTVAIQSSQNPTVDLLLIHLHGGRQRRRGPGGASNGDTLICACGIAFEVGLARLLRVRLATSVRCAAEKTGIPTLERRHPG